MTENTAEKDMKLGKMLLILVILAIACISLIYFFSPRIEEEAQKQELIQETENIPLAQLEQTGGVRYPTSQERLEERYTVNREGYQIVLDKQGKDTFGALPPLPTDFGEITYLVSTGKITDFSEITSDYYLQPEFYPLFVKNGLQFYEKYDPRYTGTFGFGIYPSEQWIEAKQGTQGKIEFFFKTGWGIETYQGINLVTETDCEGITVEIINPLFVSPPTYPEFCVEKNCGEDWARKIEMNINISETAPTTECLITLKTSSVPQEQNEEWFHKYLTQYVQGSGSMVTAGIPLQVHLGVVK